MEIKNIIHLAYFLAFLIIIAFGMTFISNGDDIIANDLLVKGIFKLENPVENDLLFPINVLKVPTTKAPEVDLYTLNFDADNIEESYLTFQLPHTRATMTKLEPHFHWQTEDNTNGTVVWCIEVSIANLNNEFSEWDKYCTNAYSLNNSNIHIYSDDIDIVDNISFSPSAMGKVKLYRDAININDTYEADAKLLEFDIHIYNDKLGENI